MPDTRADEYRRWAAQCLSFAEEAERDEDKATWLEAAGHWLRKAEEAERNRTLQQAPQPQLISN
jgi:hypothetical protein